MVRKVARHRDQDVSALVGVAPLIELPHTCLQHLIGVEAGVLPEQRVRESGDKCRGRVAQREMARDQPSGRVDLPLAIECAQQSRADFLDRVRKVVQSIAAFAGQPRGWHIEVAGEVDRHRPMKHATGRVDPVILLDIIRGGSFQRLVNGVGVGEEVEGRLPVGMLVRGAETSNAQRRRVGQRAAEIGRGCPHPDRRLERRQDRVRIIPEDGRGQLRMTRPAIAAMRSSEKLGKFRRRFIAYESLAFASRSACSNPARAFSSTKVMNRTFTSRAPDHAIGFASSIDGTEGTEQCG
jgi:hypothetical protein